MILGEILCAGVSLYALYANAEDIYKYDAKGNLVEKNTGSKKFEYTYDSNGNNTSTLVYSNATALANNTPTSKNVYTYDSNGNQTSDSTYSYPSGTCESTPYNKYEYTYDVNGNLTSKLYYLSYTAVANNTPIVKYEYAYDANGNQTSFINYSCSGGTCSDTPSSITTYTYELDDYGNVLKKYQKGSLRESHIYSDEYYYNQWLANRKLRFTMQEADELTTNDNNNWVEWTFE